MLYEYLFVCMCMYINMHICTRIAFGKIVDDKGKESFLPSVDRECVPVCMCVRFQVCADIDILECKWRGNSSSCRV